MVRGLMSDEEWSFFEAFVVATGGKSGRPPADHRKVLDGIFWIARTGAPWRDLHEDFGSWNSVYQQFRRWAKAGIFELMLGALSDQDGPPAAVQMIDSTIVRAHHQAAGAKGGLEKEGFGRSKGGFTTKIHLRTNAEGLPIAAEITGGEVSDYKGYDLVMDAEAPDPKVFIADKGYDSMACAPTSRIEAAFPSFPCAAAAKSRSLSTTSSTPCETGLSVASTGSRTPDASQRDTTRPPQAISPSSRSSHCDCGQNTLKVARGNARPQETRRHHTARSKKEKTNC